MPRGNAVTSTSKLTSVRSPSSQKSDALRNCKLSLSEPARVPFNPFNEPRKTKISDSNPFAILADLNDKYDSSLAPNLTPSMKSGRVRRRGKRGGKNSRNGRTPARYEALNDLFKDLPLLSPNASCSNITLRKNDSPTKPPPARSTKLTRPVLNTPTRSLSSTSGSLSLLVKPKLISRRSVSSPASTPRKLKPSPTVQATRNKPPPPPSPYARLPIPLRKPYILPPPKFTPFTPFSTKDPLIPLRTSSRFFPTKPLFQPATNPLPIPSFLKLGHARNCWCCLLRTPPVSPDRTLQLPPTPAVLERRCKTVESSPATTPVKDEELFEVISESEDRDGWTVLHPEASDVDGGGADDEVEEMLAEEDEVDEVGVRPLGGGVYVDERGGADGEVEELNFPWEWMEAFWEWPVVGERSGD